MILKTIFDILLHNLKFPTFASIKDPLAVLKALRNLEIKFLTISFTNNNQNQVATSGATEFAKATINPNMTDIVGSLMQKSLIPLFKFELRRMRSKVLRGYKLLKQQRRSSL